MKRIETVQEMHEVEKYAEWTCDVCGTPAAEWDGAASPQLMGFDSDMGDFDAGARVVLDASRRFYDMHEGREWSVDVCPSCFVTKLVPWIESFGRVKIKPEETDW